YFGKSSSTAREAYLKFCADDLAAKSDDQLPEGGFRRLIEGGWEKPVARDGASARTDERVLGSGSSVEKALQKSEELERWRSRARRHGITLEVVLHRVADATGVPLASLNGSSKVPDRVRARALACYWLVERFGWSEVAVATRLGITQSAVSRRIRRGQALSSTIRVRLPGGQ